MKGLSYKIRDRLCTFLPAADLCRATAAGCNHFIKTLCNQVSWFLLCCNSPETCKSYRKHADTGVAMCELDLPINRRQARRCCQMSIKMSSTNMISFIAFSLISMASAQPSQGVHRLCYVIIS